MDVNTQIDATNLSSQPTAAVMGQAIPQNHFGPMVGQLRAHTQTTCPTPPPLRFLTLPLPLHHQSIGGCSRRQCPGTPHSWRTRSNDLVLTTILAGGCSISVSMFCIFMDRWLCGVSVHISTSTLLQMPHSPPSGLRLWDVPPLTLTLTLILALTF